MSQDGGSKKYEVVRQWFFIALAGLSVLFALVRVFSSYEKADHEVLLFLVAAGVFLILDRIKKFNLTKDGISYELAEQIKEKMADLNEKVSQVKQVSKVNQLILSGGVGKRMKSGENVLKIQEYVEGHERVAGDPRKKQFGGSPVSQDELTRLSAKVSRVEGSRDFFNVHLFVRGTMPQKELQGKVVFFLHDTFNPPVRMVMAKNNVAELQLVSYGAFTVGAVIENTGERLELDLAEDASFPEEFRSR